MASLIVKTVIGTDVNMGVNSTKLLLSMPLVFRVEVLASALLMMAVILVVVYTKGLRGFSGIVIGAIVDLDIFFFAFVSGASMNHPRSLAPVLLSGGMV